MKSVENFLCFKGVFVYYIISYTPVTYGDYVYPSWAEGMGLLISFSSMIWVPGYAIYYLFTQPGSFSEVRFIQKTREGFTNNKKALKPVMRNS